MGPFANTFLNITPILEKTPPAIKVPGELAAVVLSSNYFAYLQIVLFSLSVIFFIGIALLVTRIQKIHKRNHKAQALFRVRLKTTKSKRWEIVEGYMQSQNPAEWKLAIMEADSILEDLVKKMGHTGSLGEMLKQIEKSDFTTLDDAWEAHKVRNYIAHQGSTYLLTRHQAQHTIRLFEKVFKEFEYI